MKPGKSGLGFGVGKEPLPAVMATYGCSILATDWDRASAERMGWRNTNQHACSLEELDEQHICDKEKFNKLDSFRIVDMNNIDSDLKSLSFDFLWSCCTLELLGSIQRGMKFIKESLKCLKPEGIAVHTLEYNVSSNRETIEKGRDVLFRRKDIPNVD